MNEQRSGYGTTHFLDTDGFESKGELLDGKKHGWGTKPDQDGTYTGAWRYNKRHGYGKYTSKIGNVYTGAWINDTANGQGTMTYRSRDVYTGAFVNNYREGQGTITYYESRDKYTGAWMHDKRNGQGTYTYADGTREEREYDMGRLVPHT